MALDSLKQLAEGSLRIELTVTVPSDGVRGIVVGRQGDAIRSVGKAARLELEKMWKCPVHLFINVKVQK